MINISKNSIIFFFVLALVFPNHALGVGTADLDGNGRVDILDYNILLSKYSLTGAHGFTPADIDTDGDVDMDDFKIFKANFGKTTTSSLSPKPSTSPQISTGIPCSSLSGIERRFPCSPLVIGQMPENVSSKTDAWDMFLNILYPGTSNGVNERFSAVANPVGSGVVIRNQNVLSDSEKHTTVGTGRSLPIGSTECSAFRWLWKDANEFPQRGWVLVWQLQMEGSPIVAIETDPTKHDWFFKSRNGSDSGLKYRLGNIEYGKWAYFVVCTHLDDAPNGWTKVWFRHDAWPDVNAAPMYERSGHDTYQGKTGHNTIGMYADHDGSSTSYYGYFDRYGRASTPARAITIAGNP